MSEEKVTNITGIFFKFLTEKELPLQKNTIFFKMEGVCGELVHIGRPHTRINNSVSKKIQCNVFSMKKTKKDRKKYLLTQQK